MEENCLILNNTRERFLCICEQGDNRSVHLAYLLKKDGKEAIAIGIKEIGQNSYNILSGWADKIIILDKDLLKFIPLNEKNILMDIGKDIFSRPLNKELINILEKNLMINSMR